MDPQHAVYPQRVAKKGGFADLTYLAHVVALANLCDFGDFAHLPDVLNITSPAEGVPT